MTKRYWFDTEFIDDGKTIELISIGVVDEDDRMFYAENLDVDWSKAHSWVLENVKPHLIGGPAAMHHSEIGPALQAFVDDGGDSPEFWAWFASYDWICLSQLFGRMLDVPRGWPQGVMDLRQMVIREYNNVRLPAQNSIEHNALNDAIWTKEAWNYLVQN
jgi:hypothetical protein